MKTSIKKALSFILCALMLVSFSLSSLAFESEEVSVERPKLTQNQINIAARGDYMYGLTWVCQKTITAHAYSSYYTYYAGNTYRMPYGQGSTSYYIGYGVSPEDFLKAAADVNSIFYTQKSYVSSWYSSYYIQDCSGFVSWCWGLTAKQSTRSLGNVSSYVASITTNNIKNYLQVGDALNRYDYHVVLVTDIKYDSAGNMTEIEITEQTIPETKRTVYSPAGLASEYYNYDGIYRYYGTVPAAPAGGVTTTNKLDGNSHVDLGKDFYARISNPATNKYLTDENQEVWARDLTGDSNQVWHFMRQASGAYLIGNGATAKFMSAKNAEYKDGTRIITESATFDPNQKFYIYYINNAFHFMPEGGDKTLDVDGSLFHVQLYGNSTENGKSDVAYKARSFNIEILNIYDGTKTISNLGESFQATIKNKASGKYVTASGSTLIAADESGADNQKFNFTRLPNGAYTIVSQSENLAVDVYCTLLAEGTNVDMYNLHGGNAQTFFLIQKDGAYYIKSTYTLNALHMDSSKLDFYAYSTGDDAAKIAAQLFEIEIVGSEDELILKDSSSYSKDETLLEGVVSGATASEVLSNFENKKAVVSDANGNVVASGAKVGTGYTVDIISNGNKVDSVTIVINGDVTGEGIVDGTDYLRIKSVFMGTLTLEDAFLRAADVDSTGSVDGTDYLRVKGHFLGTYNLFA